MVVICPRCMMLPVISPVGGLSSTRHYFFLPELRVGCHPAVFWLGAAAITLIFSFLGFLASRLPLCSPLAMSISLGLMVETTEAPSLSAGAFVTLSDR